MKWSFAICIILLSQCLVAQDSSWFSIGKEWTYHYIIGFSRDFSYMTLTVDEAIKVEGRSCFVLRPKIYQDSASDKLFTEVELSDMVLCQSGDTIYRYVDDDFHELYNFDHKMGDTVKIYIALSERRSVAGQMVSYAYYIVDSIDQVTIDGHDLQTNFYRSLDIGQRGYIFQRNIESIGNMRYMTPYSDVDCDAACPGLLRCVRDDERNVKFTSWPCDTSFMLSSSLEDILLGPEFNVFPNPIIDHGMVSIFELPEGQYIIDVMTVDGETVHHDTFKGSEYSFPTELLAHSQIYFIKIQNGQHYQIKKLFRL